MSEEKRIIIFGIYIWNKKLYVREYGDFGDEYKRLCEVVEVYNDCSYNLREVDFYENLRSGYVWFVRGCKGLFEYYNYKDLYECYNKVVDNIKKYKNVDVDWNEEMIKDFEWLKSS